MEFQRYHFSKICIYLKQLGLINELRLSQPVIPGMLIWLTLLHHVSVTLPSGAPQGNFQRQSSGLDGSYTSMCLCLPSELNPKLKTEESQLTHPKVNMQLVGLSSHLKYLINPPRFSPWPDGTALAEVDSHLPLCWNVGKRQGTLESLYLEISRMIGKQFLLTEGGNLKFKFLFSKSTYYKALMSSRG